MITSIQNKFVKRIYKLRQRKERHRTKQFLIEGFHLLEEAVNSHWTVEEMIVRENVTIPEWATHLPKTIVSEYVFNYLSQTETPQGMIGIVKMKDVSIEYNNKVLLLDAIQDPGNLGTIIRT